MNKQAHLKKPGRSVASLVRRRIDRTGSRFWRHADFPNLPPSAVAMELSRLARQGTLRRVGKGVYYHPTPTSFGPSIPAASSVAAETLTATLHPAGLSAANVLGLTTQNPRLPEYATPAAGRPSALSNAIVHTRRPAERAALSAEEGALLEVLRERAQSSDLSPEETAKRLLRFLADEQRFERLAHAARKEPPRVRAMLGALGEELGMSPRALDRLRQSLNRLSRFDFGRLASLRHARAWQAK